MKTFLLAAGCLAMMLPAVTSAQENLEHGAKAPPNRPAGEARPAQGAARPGPANAGARPGGAINRPAGNAGWAGQNRPAPQNGQNRPAPQYGVTRSAPQYGASRPGWSGNNGARRGNWSGARAAWGWNGQRYRGGRFNYPAGYRYQRWAIGGILPALFLSQSYYFSDYASLGFEAPPWGYQWVRYGPDLLLVNVNTGQVMDVEYGVFY